ncbi:hypothetical protein [Flaviaesturariibacter amylovorans]|uniref:DUF4129 domain-containing protein n=1 Tax=Flaviaesturariibacter amylovorans TaxID=1084520 RepID=A0ABP8GZ62_9BACT
MNAPALPTPAHRWLALHRLTALWAFGESGLGGVMHALKVPFTGLLVGSFAVICISLIGRYSEGHYRRILHSLLLVLIIKAAVSPHSPPTAYLAVSFQALVGYLLFSLGGVRKPAIYTLAILALLESAVQKLLTLTLFFGRSFWQAADELVAYIGRELSVALPDGALLLTGIYLGIYLLGGLACGAMATRLVADSALRPDLPACPAIAAPPDPVQRRRRSRAALVVLLLAAICAIRFLEADSARAGSRSVVLALLWTGTALIVWYGILAPFVLGLLRRYLRRQGTAYQGQVDELLGLLPQMRHLSHAAWQESRARRGWRRVPLFLRLLIFWSLTAGAPELQEALP